MAPTLPVAPSSFEFELGTNWLNKLGVLVFVTGVALLVRYSFTYLGPAGRVGIGYLLSLALLGTGVVMERRRGYAAFGFGLVAGGWAGAYFTTYAAHAIEAARIIDSQALATVLLVAVAGGMVVHSLKYRSQTVTGLAYVVAFFTLGITPMTGFSLLASLPLAASLLVVAQRFGWTGASTLGVVSTYALFSVRGGLTRDAFSDTDGLVPYLMLAAYWITFEIADVMGLRASSTDRPKPAPVFALNAFGLVGAAMVVLPQDRPDRLAAFLGVTAVAYLASAVLRRRLVGGADVDDAAVSFTTFHGAAAMAAVLGAWSVAIEFHGTRQTFAWLLEAELLFAAGLTMGDRVLRSMGAVAAVLVTLSAWSGVTAGGPARPDGWRLEMESVAGLATAAAWYVNREWLHARRRSPWAIERGYTWAAGLLVLAALTREIRADYQGLAGLLLAATLLAAGYRDRTEYRRQAWIVGPVAALWIVLRFAVDVPGSAAAVWQVLPISIALLFGAAAVLARRASDARDEWRTAAAVASVLGTALLMVFEYRVFPEVAVGPAWAATALALQVAGTVVRAPGLRWQAYALVTLGALRAFRPIVLPDPASETEVVAIAVTLACAYATTIVARFARTAARDAGRPADTEEAAAAAVELASTALLTWLLYDQVPASMLTLAWGLEGLVLLTAGFAAGERMFRYSGLGLLLVCSIKLVGYDLRELDALARTFSFVLLGLALIAVSWIYTRYRARSTSRGAGEED